LSPEDRITLAQASNSILDCRANCAGVLATGSKPSTARLLDLPQREDVDDFAMQEAMSATSASTVRAGTEGWTASTKLVSTINVTGSKSFSN
jgi:hypothetical protein